MLAFLSLVSRSTFHSRAYIPVLYVFNKIDSITIEELDILDQMPNYVPISSQHEWNLEELMEEIWNRCNMLRVYTKPKGQIPDYEEPVILHAANPTIEEFCNRWVIIFVEGSTLIRTMDASRFVSSRFCFSGCIGRS